MESANLFEGPAVAACAKGRLHLGVMHELL